MTSPLGNSDHCGLRVSLKLKTYKTQDPMPRRKVWNYRDADFEKASEMIRSIDWTSILPTDDPDSATIIWQSKFLEIMSECVPQHYLSQRRKVPWLTSNVVRHIRKRNAAFNAAKKCDFQDLTKYKKLRNKVISMLRKEKWPISKI